MRWVRSPHSNCLPLLTELGRSIAGSGCYRHGAPSGAFTAVKIAPEVLEGK
jgi:hypothetical protein